MMEPKAPGRAAASREKSITHTHRVSQRTLVCWPLLPRGSQLFFNKPHTVCYSLKYGVWTHDWSWKRAVAKYNTSLICCWLLAVVPFACLTLFWKIANSQKKALFDVKISDPDFHYVYVHTDCSNTVVFHLCIIMRKQSNNMLTFSSENVNYITAYITQELFLICHYI